MATTRDVFLIKDYCRNPSIKDMISTHNQLAEFLQGSNSDPQMPTFRGTNALAFHAFQLAEEPHSTFDLIRSVIMKLSEPTRYRLIMYQYRNL